MKVNMYFISILCLLFLCISSSARCQINLDQGLVAYYPLNSNGLDFGSNRRNMSPSGSPVAVEDYHGNAGMAMSFNGSNSYFSAGNHASYQGMRQFSISVRFKTSVLKDQMFVAKHSGGTDGEFYFGTTSSGIIRFTRINSSNNRVDGNFSFAYNDGQWHHAVAVYNGSRVEVFVDGTSIGSMAHSGNTKSTTHPLRIGYYSGTDWFFNGALDEVYVYDKALNTEEIAALGKSTVITVGSIMPEDLCSGSTVSIPFTVSGDTPETGNVFTAYLSDATGNFSNRSIIGTVAGTESGTISGTIGTSVQSGSAYRLMVVSSNQPLVSTGDNGTNLSITDPLNGLADLSSNLFGLFPFNGNTGDSSGYSRNLGINGSVGLTEDRYGHEDKAYHFNGGYMNWGKIGEINNGGSALSIALWLKPEVFSTHFIPIANNWNASWGGVYMGINDSGNGIRWRVSSNNYVCVGPNLTLNEWVHVVGIFGSGRLKLYYDGVEVANVSCPANITGVDMNFMLGREASGASNVHYRGGMDDVRFFKRELNPDEVKAIYHEGLVYNNSGLCIGETLNLSTITIPGATYFWTGPDDFSSSEQNPSISNVSSANAGSYSLTITNNGCIHHSSSTIIVNSELEAVSASNDGPLCDGETLSLSSTTVAGATYSWSGPEGFTSSDQNPVMENAMSHASGTYTVTIIKGICNRMAETDVTVYPIPVSPTVESNSPVCKGETLNLNTGTVAGATYSWSGPGGFISTHQNPVRTGMDMNDAGTYSVRITANGCESLPADVAVTVNTVGVVTASGSGPYCEGEDIQLSATYVEGAAYSWTGPNSFTSIVQNPSISSATTNVGGSYTVIATLGDCSEQSAVNVIVYARPEAIAESNSPVCEGSALRLMAETISGATYSWAGPGGFTSTHQNPEIDDVAGISAGNYTVTVSIGNCSQQNTTAIVVNPVPDIPEITFEQSPDRLLSSASSGNQWNLDGVPLPGEDSQEILLEEYGTYSVTVIASNGCSSVSEPYSFVITSVMNGSGIGSIESFPNPSAGLFTISGKNIQARKVHLTIRNTQGTMVLDEVYPVHSGRIDMNLDLQHLAKGVYYLHFSTVSGNTLHKIVVQ